jgi:hypothetical protein
VAERATLERILDKLNACVDEVDDGDGAVRDPD